MSKLRDATLTQCRPSFAHSIVTMALDEKLSRLAMLRHAKIQTHKTSHMYKQEAVDEEVIQRQDPPKR